MASNLKTQDNLKHIYKYEDYTNKGFSLKALKGKLTYIIILIIISSFGTFISLSLSGAFSDDNTKNLKESTEQDSKISDLSTEEIGKIKELLERGN